MEDSTCECIPEITIKQLYKKIERIYHIIILKPKKDEEFTYHSEIEEWQCKAEIDHYYNILQIIENDLSMT